MTKTKPTKGKNEEVLGAASQKVVIENEATTINNQPHIIFRIKDDKSNPLPEKRFLFTEDKLHEILGE